MKRGAGDRKIRIGEPRRTGKLQGEKESACVPREKQKQKQKQKNEVKIFSSWIQSSCTNTTFGSSREWKPRLRRMPWCGCESAQLSGPPNSSSFPWLTSHPISTYCNFFSSCSSLSNLVKPSVTHQSYRTPTQVHPSLTPSPVQLTLVLDVCLYRH